MKREQLEEIIKKHIEWLNNDKDGERADLYNANLYNANLYNANLYNANLRNADLENADLRNADLENADLRNADLRNANLYNADLRNANLRNADLEKIIIQLPNICKWYVIYNEYNDKSLMIGCESKTIKEWDKLFKSKIKEYEGIKRDSKEHKLIYLAFKTIKEYLKIEGVK